MNYKILGADQKEYGPVSLEQVRQWLAEGRLNGQSMVQPEGETGWKPLNSVPELSELLTPAAAAVPTAGQQVTPAPFSAQPMPAPADLPGDPAKDLRVPGITLIVVAGLGILMGLFGLVGRLLGWAMFTIQNLPPDMPPPVAKWLAFSMGPAPAIGGLVLNVVILFGGLSMLRMERWGLALAACIIAMLCGNPCCCPIGLAAGIWGLIVLVRPEVKSAFH